jgi:serine/threonine-protein kinase
VSFIKELRRRKVIQLVIYYFVAGFVILEGADVLVPALALPSWVNRLIALLLILGFPLALVLAWLYDWTPGGIKATGEAEDTPAAKPPEATEAATTRAAPQKASVAVLPFVNISGDPQNEYFSDGLSEELLNVLAKIDSLKVAARTSSFHFKGQTGDIAEISRQLGVASVLEGSVRQSGSRVRITTQLISAADGYHLWSETFDRELDDIFAVQDEIASAVAAALKVKLLDEHTEHEPVAGGTTDPEAFRAYLLGVHYRNRGDHRESVDAAIRAFGTAVRLDPGYARAYAERALSWGQMAANSFVSYSEGVGNMEADVTRALELAPGLAEAYLAEGRLLYAHKLDIKGGYEAFAKARRLNPGNVEMQLEYSRINCYCGRYEEAIAAARTALELDPVSLFANHFLGHILYFSRRYDDAVAVFRHVLEMEPAYPKPHYFIAMSYYNQGDYDAAWEEIQLEPLQWMLWTGSALALQKLGRLEEADSFLARLNLEDNQEFATVQRADIYAQRNAADLAMQSLDLAYELGDPGLSQVLVDPFLDPLRDDPRFIRLVEKLGFEPPTPG